MFFNTNLPYERVRLLKTEKELLDMPEDSKTYIKVELLKSVYTDQQQGVLSL